MAPQAKPHPRNQAHRSGGERDREYPRMVEMREADAVLILASLIVAQEDAHDKGFHEIETRIVELAERWFPE